MTLKQQLERLIKSIDDEFETHAVKTAWVYTLETRTLIIKISYPLSKESLFADCKVPKTKLKAFFQMMKKTELFYQVFTNQKDLNQIVYLLSMLKRPDHSPHREKHPESQQKNHPPHHHDQHRLDQNQQIRDRVFHLHIIIFRDL